MCQRITPSWQEHANIIAIEGVHHSSCCDHVNPPADNGYLRVGSLKQ